MDKANKKTLGRLALFSAAFLWGLSFVAMKNVLTNIPTLYVLAIRFCGAALILLPFCARSLKKIDKKYIASGALMGAILLLAYISQTYGLSMTTPGKNAFLTSAYCIIVPFLYWIHIYQRYYQFPGLLNSGALKKNDGQRNERERYRQRDASIQQRMHPKIHSGKRDKNR